MVPVTLSMNAPDTCNTSCSLTAIAGTDGATAADYQITGPMSASLRGAANSAAGRVYKLAIACTDPATGLAANKVVSVSVAGTAAPAKQLGN
jgi:hypothetical protein